MHGESKYVITAYFVDVRFIDDEMVSNWYNGKHPLRVMFLHAQQLDRIHPNAFTAAALCSLWHLWVYIDRGALYIHDDAFRGLFQIEAVQFFVKKVESLPRGMLDPTASSIWAIHFASWPNEINLSEMFANGRPYQWLNTLDIRNVQLPQTKFRRLSAANFTSFRRLAKLTLFNCGIEVIDEDTFDAVGQTLDFVHLGNNWIKMINLEMFRQLFETKKSTKLGVHSNKVNLLCTCALIEIDIMACPFDEPLPKMCIKCKLVDNFDGAACGVQRNVNFTKICVPWLFESIVTIIDVRMAGHRNGTIALETKFASKIRMLLINLDGMDGGKCAERVTTANYLCLKINRYNDHLDLRQFDKLRGAEFISITAIPILSDFGARPMHLMTVRQRSMDEGLPSIATIVLGVIVGVLGGSICGGMVKKLFQTCAVNKSKSPRKHDRHSIEAQSNANRADVITNASNNSMRFERTQDVLQNDYL